MNVSYKINNILTNKCTRAIGNSKPARTSSYDGTESRDTMFIFHTIHVLLGEKIVMAIPCETKDQPMWFLKGDGVRGGGGYR